MAGDWFPMGYWRSRCPEVVLISSLGGRDRHEVLGWLCDLWSWVSSESEDGLVPGLTLRDLVEVIGADEQFWRAVQTAGWLSEEGGGIVIPNWENWLSQSAKKRAKERNKKRSQRSRSRPQSVPKVSPKCPPKKGTTGQDRREEKKEEETPLPPAEPGGGTGDYPAVPATGEEEDFGPPPGGPRRAEPRTHPPGDFDPTAEPAIVAVEPFEELLAEWVAAKLPGHDAPGGIDDNGYRRGHFQARQRDPKWRTRWREAVRKAGRSRACRGEDPGFLVHGLRLDTFLARDNTVARIMEGEFDDGRVAAAKGGGGKRTVADVIAADKAKRAQRQKPTEGAA